MGKDLRIFVIGPRGFPGVQGGIERFSENLYSRLADLGYDVTTFAMKGYCSHKSWRGVKFIYTPTIPIKNLEKTIYNLYSAVYCIIKRPDIVHVHSIASGLFIFLMKIFKLRIVARYNSRDYLHSKWNSVGKYILKKSEKQFFLADHIITNNRDYQLILQSMSGKSNISFIPNGVDIPDKQKYLSLFEDQFGSLLGKSRFILYVGRITPEKNIETLLEAFTLITGMDLKLVIAGDSAQDINYFKTVKDRYQGENIIFPGKIDSENLNCLYAKCSLFVLPSLFEGMPNALLEAMSFDCKILVSRIPAHLQFDFGDCYFEPTNATELKSKIVAKLASGKKEDYRLKLLSHDWPSIVKQIHAIHLLLLKK